MGRYYSGDIEGKFWFAVQSSDAASRFGGEEHEPQYISYNFDKEEHFEGVQRELKAIEDKVGIENIKAIEDCFGRINGYNDSILEKEGILEIWNEHKSDYADYVLGKKIEKHLIDNDYCQFDAEL